jgi:hypothetical protein
MKARITMGFEVEVEGDDAAANELRKTVELQWAHIVEQIEAILVERVLPLHPGLKISVGKSDEENG